MVKIRPVLDRTPATGERLVIHKNGTSVIMPYAYTITDDGKISWRKKDKDRAYAHGADCAGDGKVDARKIKLSVYLRGATQTEYDKKYNDLIASFAGSDYTLTCGREDRVYKVAAVTAVSQRYLKGYKQRWSDVDLTLLLADPFRYAVKSTTKTNIFDKAQTDTTIIINNPSSVDVPLIFTFKPLQTMADIKVMHVESGEQFVLTDALLTAPAVGVVNAETGTVRRDSNNAINAFAGLFLHALAGFNTYKVTCEAGTVDINYTARWFV